VGEEVPSNQVVASILAAIEKLTNDHQGRDAVVRKEDLNKLLADAPKDSQRTGMLTMALVGFIRENRQAISSGQIRDWLSLLARLRPSQAVRINAFRELVKIPEPERSAMLCQHLGTAGPGAEYLMEGWGVGSAKNPGVEQVVIGQVIQWPTCDPDGLAGIARKIVEWQGVQETDVGLTGYPQILLVEKFAAWAMRQGYLLEPVVDPATH
jgi:hypothetical protein